MWAALAAGCATHRVDAGMAAVEPAAPRPVALALVGDPPLPGERLDGWHGLQTPTTTAQDRSGTGFDGELLDLPRALALARAHNPDLGSAEADAEAARWSATQAGRLPNPTVELETFRTKDGVEVEGGIEIALTDALLAPARATGPRCGKDTDMDRRSFLRGLGAVAAGAVWVREAHPNELPDAAHGAPLATPGARSPLVAPGQPAVVTPTGSTLPWRVVDGVKVGHLVAEPIRHEFAPGLRVGAWGYNGGTPGPTIEAVDGDRLRLYVRRCSSGAASACASASGTSPRWITTPSISTGSPSA